MISKTLRILGAVGIVTSLLFKKKGIELYNQYIGQERVSIALNSVDDFNVGGGNISLTMKLQVINGAPIDMKIDKLHTRLSVINAQGNRTLLFQSNPTEQTEIKALANQTTIVDVPLIAPVINIGLSALNILSTKQILLEIAPTVAGIDLPQISHSIDFNANILKSLFSKK